MLILWFCVTLFYSVFIPGDHGSVSAQNPQNKSVIIIGGGVSGLKAATKFLATKGFSVTVLEASDKIGGRISSRQLGDYFVEFGAEWIHGEVGNSVYELMEPYGLFIKEEDLVDENNNNGTEAYDDSIFATQAGEEMRREFSVLIQRLELALRGLEEKDSTDSFFNSTKKLFWNSTGESLGEFAGKLFEEFNKKYPLDERKEIRSAALDWLHRSINVEDAADTWFQISNRDDGDQFEYLDGSFNVPWKYPATYSSLLKVILDQPPNNTNEIKIPSWVKLNQEVTEIQYSTKANDKIAITTKSGDTYKADHVITTASLGVLKERHTSLFNPKLPEKKQLAIEHIGFGTVDKIYLEFKDEWWFEVDENFSGVNPLWEMKGENELIANWNPNATEKELLAEVDGMPIWTRGIHSFSLVHSNSHPKVLQGWLSGVSARFMETQPLEYVTKSCMKLLRTFLSKRFPNIPDPINTARSNWFTNPYTKGSYSFRTLAADKFNVWAKDLAEPILNDAGVPIVLFAGEATHENYFSTVHGAYDSGVRAADQILNSYKLSDN